MVIDLHDITRNLKKHFLLTEKRKPSAVSGKGRIAPHFNREELMIFLHRFSITFRETFAEWRRWAWPTMNVAPASALMRHREESVPAPQIGVSRQEGAVVVRAELPGLRGEDVRVEFFEGVLILSGKYRVIGEGDTVGVETFFRTLTLPEGITGRDATIEVGEGRLEISMTIPRREQTRRTVEVV